MIVRKGFVFRLKLDFETEGLIRRAAGCCRFVWNQALAVQKARLDRGERVQSYDAMCDALLLWKRSPATAFLSDVHSQPLQQTLKDLRRAFDDFFDPAQPKKAFPRFKKKSRGKDAFRYPQGVLIDNRRVYLPKIGWVRFYKSREIEGTMKNMTVRLRAGKWYVSIQTERDLPDPVEHREPVVGGDLGITRFLTLSDGTMFEPLNSFRTLEEKLAKAQRQLSRKITLSSNWKTQKTKIARVHARIANARQDFLHKLSTTIAKTHGVVVLEDLPVKNMSASAKGTIEQPGRNVRAKSGLNTSILDQGWFEFRRQLDYKLAWAGGWLIAVPPQNTSRTCPACGHVSAENRQTQARFACVECGFEEHADVVGAINVLAAGHAVMACESSPIVGRKQEPPETSHRL
jgi:putative transposase